MAGRQNSDTVYKTQPPPLDMTMKRGSDDMYTFSTLDFTNEDIKNRYKAIKQPLSIFAPFSHEEPEPPPPEPDRPVTPINDEIQSAPTNFNILTKLIRRRIAPKPDILHMSTEDQGELGDVIMGEVSIIWPHLRSPVDYPFLSADKNKELHRRIAVHIVDGCQTLFNDHVAKLKVLNKRGIFSGLANMTRLKAQLAIETSNLLNISTIRRKVLEQLKSEISVQDAFQKHRKESDCISFKLLAKTTKLANRMRLSKNQATTEQEIKEMMKHMPSIYTADLLDLMAGLPVGPPGSTLPEESESTSSRNEQPAEVPVSRLEGCQQQQKLERALSVPGLTRHETLLQEMGYGLHDNTPHSITDDTFTLYKGKDKSTAAVSADNTAPGTTGSRQGATDLARLLQRGDADALHHLQDDNDLPPLLQALTRHAKHDGKAEQIKRQLRELEKREQARAEADMIDIQEAKFPQPATVTTKVPNKMTVKTSDMRVSERVCLSTLTLNKYLPIYNDLIDEISAENVKKLDSNLFLGDEIREVYSQIMDTVPKDHLLLEQDALTEPTADAINITSTLSSSTLRHRRTERVINPKLNSREDAPWGEHSVSSWANLPQTFLQNLATGEVNDLRIHTGEGKQEEVVPVHMQGFMARSYASWYQWWRNTVNSDDYMKYLSTQETDYLGVVFHFYNSDEEDEGEEDAESRARQASKQQLQQERQSKMAELREQKETYEPGFWNVNSVLLGGLGRDPHIVEEEAEEQMSLGGSEATAPMKMAHTGTTVLYRSKVASHDATPRQTGLDTAPSGAASHNKSHNTQLAAMEGPQDRLEKVWAALRMPDNLRLDMAIKYSSDAYFPNMDNAIEAWEEVTGMITKRETILVQLENFERTASDPNRFFEKGARGSSVARLDEAKTRSSLYRRIDMLDEKLAALLTAIKDNFNDNVTYQGRPYLDKMKWDRVEMLYWLKEERKQQLLSLHPASSLPPAATSSGILALQV